MVRNKSIYLVLLCALVLSKASTQDKIGNATCIPSERYALLAFRAGLIDPKNRLSSWKGHDCCQWRGVTCSNTTAHVIRLDLRNTYVGYYDSYEEWLTHMSYALGGEVRSSILLLQHLNYLDLSYNNFSGAKIPEFIGSFTDLTYLNLSNAEFGGKIPPQLGNLSSLQYLDISYISSNTYSNDVTWLAHLSSLKHLDMSWVNLSNAINIERFGMLPQLQTLCLNGCGLDDTTFTLSHVNFTELVTLELHSNELSNPLSFNWIQNISKLNYVDFSFNKFDHRLLNALGSINSIETLYLGWNNLINIKSSNLKNLSNLKALDLRSNQISGDITEFIGGLSSHGLQSLYLDSNNLNGNISSWIGHMKSLSTLMLASNNLSGPIPLSIRELTQLVELDLSNNNFYGTITEHHLSKMTNLKYLYLAENPLSIIMDANWMPRFRLREIQLSSCNLGLKFPQWLRMQTNVSLLDLSNTNIIDELPVWFWHVFSNTRYLNLSKNKLSAWMPTSLEFMSTLTLLLNDNNFQGSIPKLPKSLYELDLSKNALSGQSLPLNMKDLPLSVLLLKENQLNGSIPQSLCQSQQLRFLDLSRNFLKGNIPNCWGNDTNAIKNINESFEKPIVLKTLILSHNNLTGQFPQYVKYCSKLILLNLENNNFVDHIPPWIGEKLPLLRFLLLGSNKFSGTIPNQLLELKQLQILDLSHNNLNGMIPYSLRSLKEMTIIDDGNTEIDQFWFTDSYVTEITTDLIVTEVDTKGQVLNYETNILYFKGLDLSCNNLDGNIPEEIGALVGLKNLNLSGNNFSGNIPQSIGYLQLLESLDLSTNRLSGSIPSSLSNLTTLSHLNMSYNNLFGSIPLGHQLQTLDDPSIYEGNSGLCGFPLPNECSGNKATSQPLLAGKEHSYEIYVGAIVGFAIGVWIVYGALLFNKFWRVTYFVFVDNMYSRIYAFLILNWASITQDGYQSS